MKFINRKDLVEVQGMIVSVKQRNTTEPSYIFCDKVEYLHYKEKDIFDHHIMIYKKDDLIFKVWLPNESGNKEFKDIYEALKSVGMKIRVPPYVEDKLENIKNEIQAIKKSKKKYAKQLTEKGKKSYKKGIERREKLIEKLKQNGKHM